MGADDLYERLVGWVETSGRALELRTARTFREHPLVRYANQSVAYEDPDSKQQREGDVVAAYRWTTDALATSIEGAIECKSGKSHPWVAFYDDHRQVPETPTLWFVPGGTWPSGEQERLMAEWLGQRALVTDRVATHAVSAFGSDGKNFVQDAARQTMSFARARAVANYRFVGDPEHLTLVKAVVPIVVTQAPLFTCELTQNGEVVLERVERFDMWLHLGPRVGRRRVYVRTEAALAEMAEAFQAIAERSGAAQSSDDTP